MIPSTNNGECLTISSSTYLNLIASGPIFIPFSLLEEFATISLFTYIFSPPIGWTIIAYERGRGLVQHYGESLSLKGFQPLSMTEIITKEYI